MVIGSVAAVLRKVPGQLWTFLVRRLSIAVEIPDRDPAFQTFMCPARGGHVRAEFHWRSSEEDVTAKRSFTFCFKTPRSSVIVFQTYFVLILK